MATIWTIRGVSEDMQRRVSAAAQESGMKLGRWIEKALARAVLETGSDRTDAARLAAVEQRLAELTERVASLEASGARGSHRAGKTTARPAEPHHASSGGRGGPRTPIPEEHLAEADRLNREGMSFPEIIRTKGWGYNRGSLPTAVKRYRARAT